jgi:hypothetical protein
MKIGLRKEEAIRKELEGMFKRHGYEDYKQEMSRYAFLLIE